MILDKVGRLQEAETYLREALDIRTRFLPKGNLAIGKAEGALGECLTAEKRYADAEPLLLDSYHDLTSSHIEKDPRMIEALERLVKFYEDSGNGEELTKYRALLSREKQ